MIGKQVEVLVEDYSKKSKDFYMGRTDTNKIVILPKDGLNIGDYCIATITKANSATLFADKADKIEKSPALLNSYEKN